MENRIFFFLYYLEKAFTARVVPYHWRILTANALTIVINVSQRLCNVILLSASLKGPWLQRFWNIGAAIGLYLFRRGRAPWMWAERPWPTEDPSFHNIEFSPRNSWLVQENLVNGLPSTAGILSPGLAYTWLVVAHFPCISVTIPTMLGHVTSLQPQQ